MEMEKVNINDLNPAVYNPRKTLKPGDKEYEKLKRSIQEFGYVDPIIVNKRTGNIVGGHQRYNVLISLGYEEIDVVYCDLDDKKEKALNIALNKISGKWQEETLKDILEELDNGDFDVELTGFDMEEIEKLMTKFDDSIDPTAEMEFAQELMEEHQYLVLYFDNALDWQVAKELFGIKTVAAKWSEKRNRSGVGRVVRGADILKKINDPAKGLKV